MNSYSPSTSYTKSTGRLNNLNSDFIRNCSTEQTRKLASMKPYPRTDFSFLSNEKFHENQKTTPSPKTKIEPNIYGTNNVNYLLKMKNANLANQQLQHQQQYQPEIPQYIHLDNRRKSRSQQDLNKRAEEREKFFAEYIKQNGDAASQIIPNFLYLGGHRSVNNIPNLIDDGITHVLNMAGELRLDYIEMEKNNIKLLNVLAKDSKVYNIRRDFDQAFQFIDDCLRSKGKIIINCARGISRSGTIVIAYLMFRYSMSLMESYNFITSLRPQVRPNSYFRKQLELYEHELAYNRFKHQLKNKANHNLMSGGLTQASTLSFQSQKDVRM